MVVPGRLKGVQIIGRPQPLDGRNGFARYRCNGGHAGFQRCAIGMHGTGTTQAGTAAEFGAFQLELVTYHP
jgi:hypothetical protein